MVFGLFSTFLSILCAKVLNSSSLNIFCSSSSLGSFTLSSSMLSEMFTSVLMVARNFENRIFSVFSSTFFFRAPVSRWVFCSSCSMEPNCFISFTAVFSPTPGHPGILSAVSPISPSRSITCEVLLISYFCFTSSTPISS